MTCKLFRHTITMFLTFLVLSSLMCCIDDHYDANCDQDINDDFSIAFDISLSAGPGGAMRDISQDHTDEIGDEVDYQVDVEGANNDFRILLFDKDDNFLFEPLRTYYQYGLDKLTDETYKEQKRWRVIIPASALKRQVDDNTTILDKIKTENFKIAVLANWPKDKHVEFQKDEKLQKLSHYYVDGVYAGTSSDAQKQAYSFLSDADGKMGAYTEWVNSTYGDAESAIRTEQRTDPHTITRKIGDATFPHTYKHIWRVWHFGEIGEEVNELSKNQSVVDYWKEQFTNDQKTLSSGSITVFNDYGGSTYHTDGKTDDCGLSLEGGEGCSYNGEGLTIGEGIFETKEKNVTYLTGNRLMFNAFAAGTIWICAKNASNKPCSLYVQLKDNNSSNNDTNRKPIAELKPGEDFKIYKYSSNISVTGAGSSDENAKLTIPEVVSVYAVGGPMIIKQIEYMEDKHLSDTDREGFLPSENNGQLIPMYGVQEFDAIGSYLKDGEIFNLSTASTDLTDNYNRKRIHLLRSVAKVELLIPTTFPKLTHAYLRCANRHSRCEPVDVLTPTDILWNGGTYRNRTYQTIDKEIDYIKSYGQFYDPKTSDVDKYRNKLSWFYKAWTEWTSPWNLSNNKYAVTVPTDTQYPHIFNTRINRSDYTHFRYKGQRGLYDRYVLYVPEKNIDDPNSHGKMNSTPPKVPHIELRFEGKNEDENLDDNDCYRIYFTPNNEGIPTKSSAYDDEELKHLDKFYPIVRNHIYRFTLRGFNADNIEVEVNVTNMPIPADWTTNEWGYTYEPE